MTDLTRIEQLILDEVKTADNPVHKTFIRRSLDYEFDVRITYPVVNSFLDGLCQDGYLTTHRGNYYQLAEYTEPSKAPVPA